MHIPSSWSLHSDINVTPLVDVCLVLLIIFMIVLPAMVNGEDVNLPRASSETPIDKRVLPLTVKGRTSTATATW